MKTTRLTDTRFLILSIVLSGVTFAVDLWLPLAVAGGVPYVIVVLASLWAPKRRDTYLAASTGTALTALGYLFSAAGGIFWVVLVNRALALFVIWATALLVLQRKSAEEALRETEGRYRTIFEQSPDAVLIIDPETLLPIEFNDCALRLTGHSREEFAQLRIPDYEANESPAEVREHAQKVLRTGQDTFETRLRTKSGEIRNVRVSVRLIELDGRTCLHSILHDITERLRAQKELRLRQFAIDHSSDPIYWVKADGGIAYANQAACRSLGYDVEELLSMSVPDFDPDFPRGAWPEHWEQIKASGTATFEARHRTKQGRVFPVEIATNYLEHEGQEYIWAYARDITERKEAADRAARFSRVLEHSLNEIYIFDAETFHFLEVNRGARENLGYSLEELRSLTPLDLKPEFTAESFAELVEPLRAGVEEKIQFTAVHRRKDGTQYPVEVHLQLVGEGAPVFVAIILDITERKRADEALRESEQRFRAIFEEAPVGISVTDSVSGRFVKINKKYGDICGYSQEEMLGTLFQDISHPDDLEADLSNMRVLLAGTIKSFEMQKRYLHKDGSIVWVSLTCVPLWKTEDDPRVHLAIVQDITERKRTEEELRETTSLVTNILNTSPNLIFAKDLELRTTMCNHAFAKAVGKRPEEMIGHTDIENGWAPELVHGNPDKGIRGFENDDRDALRGQHVHNPADPGNVCGEIRIFDTHKVPLRDADGRIIGVLGVSSDVTDHKKVEEALRKAHEELEQRVEQRTAELVAANAQLRREMKDRQEAEQELRASEQRYRAVVEDQTELICRWRPDGRLLFVNDAYCRYFDRSREELVGKTFMPRIAEEDRARAQEHFASLSSAEPVATLQHRALAPDGQVRWQQWTNHAIFDAQGRLSEYQSVGRDITESRHAEQALLESEERFRRAVMEAPFPIMIHAENGEVLRVNRVWTNLTGYHPEEIPTIADWTERAYGERQEAVRERIDKVYKINGRVAEGDYIITTKDGQTMIWDFSSSPLGRMEDGRRLVISMAADVTGQRRAEAQVHKQQEELAHMSRLGTMGEMATGLAHELNQPLASIVSYTSGCVQRIQSGRPDLQELVSALNDASSEARRAGEIIKRIRRFVQKREPVRTTIGISELMQQALDFMRYDFQRQGIQTRLEVEENMPTLQGDRIQLQQVLVNLLRNSVEAMNGTAMKHRCLTIGATTGNGDSVTLFIRDTGCGLGETDPDKIFEPFYTTKEDGTGMGLAISRTIVEAHGGRFSATDNADGGCTFRFSFPNVRKGELEPDSR